MTRSQVESEAAKLLVEIEDSAGAFECQDEANWWNGWRQNGDQGAHERLIFHYLPYAKTVAATYYAARFHDEIEFADYLQLASVGLVEAMNNFDPARGVQFRSFAARRMHGAILNGIDRFTEKQQQIAVRRRVMQERQEEAIAVAKAGTSSSSSRTQVALFRELAEVGIGLALSLLLADTGMVCDDERNQIGISAYDGLELKQLRERVRGFVGQLPKQEQLVIRCHYLQSMALDDVALMLGVTKGRVSQIHRKALGALRDAIKARPNCDLIF